MHHFKTALKKENPSSDMLKRRRNGLLMQGAIKVLCLLVSGRERLLTFLRLAAGSAGFDNREQAPVPSITRLQ